MLLDIELFSFLELQSYEKILKYANPFAHFLKNEAEICDLSRIRGIEAYPA